MKSRAVLRRLRRFLGIHDVHFYVGLTMLFFGLWLCQSLGLALCVVGGLVAVTGFACGLIEAFTVRAPQQPKGKR